MSLPCKRQNNGIKITTVQCKQNWISFRIQIRAVNAASIFTRAKLKTMQEHVLCLRGVYLLRFLAEDKFSLRRIFHKNISQEVYLAKVRKIRSIFIFNCSIVKCWRSIARIGKLSGVRGEATVAAIYASLVQHHMRVWFRPNALY